jgi:hypothetical protein
VKRWAQSVQASSHTNINLEIGSSYTNGYQKIPSLPKQTYLLARLFFILAGTISILLGSCDQWASGDFGGDETVGERTIGASKAENNSLSSSRAIRWRPTLWQARIEVPA